MPSKLSDHPDRFDRDLIVGLLEHQGYQVKGSAVRCPNPGHPDQTASASVYGGSGKPWRVRCHACDVSWDIFDLREMFGQPDGIEQPRPKTKKHHEPKIYPSFEALMEQWGSFVGRRYEYRRVGSDRVELCVLRPKDKKNGFRQCHEREDGSWVMTKGENKPPLFRLPDICDAKSLIVTEGEEDALALAELGFPATTSAGGSKAADRSDWSGLTAKRIYIWPDADSNGQAYAGDVARILGELYPNAELVTLDPDQMAYAFSRGGDARDFITSYGDNKADCRADLMAELEKARLRRSEGTLEEYARLIRDGRIKSVEWPFKALQRATDGIRCRSLTVWAGGSGTSKSLAMVQCLAQWLDDPYARPCMLALEMVKADHVQRALAQQLKDSRLASEKWVTKNVNEFEAAFRSVGDKLRQVEDAIDCPAMDDATVEYVLGWIERRAQAGHRVIIVDPITAIDDVRPANITSHEIIKGAFRLAGKYFLHIIFVTHTNVKGLDVQKASDELSQIAGGQGITRFSSYVFVMSAMDDANAKVLSYDGSISEAKINRNIALAKTRYGAGRLNLGFDFNPHTLLIEEKGAIVK